MTIMTEEEARTKWCPMARVQSDTSALDSPSNRTPSQPKPSWSRCLASDCACWMWYRSPEVAKRMNNESMNTSTPDIQPTGCCGIGGMKC